MVAAIRRSEYQKRLLFRGPAPRASMLRNRRRLRDRLIIPDAWAPGASAAAGFRRFWGCATSRPSGVENPLCPRSSRRAPLALLLRNEALKETVMADKLRTFGWVQAAAAAAVLAGAGCNSGTGGTNVSALPADVKAITFLQRPRVDMNGNRFNDQGNVFEYTTFHAGGRLVTLSPP